MLEGDDGRMAAAGVVRSAGRLHLAPNDESPGLQLKEMLV